MPKPPRTAPPSAAPTREAVLAYIRESPVPLGKREIARAFQVSGAARVALKTLLRELEERGLLERGRGRRLAPPAALPEVTVLEVVALDADGEVLARPVSWHDDSPPPRIYMQPERRGHPGLGVGDRVLARLSRQSDRQYQARTIRRLDGAASGVPRMVARFHPTGDGGRLEPTDRRERDRFVVAPGQTLSATPGELVLAEVLGQRRAGLRTARVVERLGAGDSPQTFSLIAIHSHGLPTEFSAAALAEAERAGPVTAEGRTDLRGLPLVTIDGADARDFDDAVAAEPDPAHPGGWHLVVAIADVAHYVRPDSALDLAAQERGNSAYFPDRVVPMLPEALSNGLCSLRPDQERACLAAHLWIDAEGQLRRHQFVRGLMRSRARLTYEQVQNARDGHPDEVTGPLLEPVIAPLYGAFHTLARARSRRGTLELDLPERQVRLDEHGHAAMITVRPRYDSHRLIEEFMIAANVAAAESLEAASQPLLYRVHDRPSREKLEALREYLASIGLRLPRGHGTKPRDFTQILQQAEHHPQHSAINEAILRAQAQAVYAPDNIGHFGLALARYAHFTSPIRRYADLVVHRALIRAHGFAGGDAGAGDWSRLERVGDHLSKTERRAAAAERDAVDRYTAAFLAERVGATFSGRVAGVTRFGLFVRLEESGADGLVPVRTLPEDWYDHDQARHCLTGRRHGVVYHLGQALAVRLTEANPITGSLLLELAEAGPLAAGERQTGGAGAPGHGKAATSRRKAFGNRGIKRTGR